MASTVLVGIISYLPDDSETRRKRIAAHQKQMKCLNDLFPSLDVFQMNQNYCPCESDACKAALSNEVRRVTFEEHGKLGISNARNRLLKEFYSSDYEFMMLMDDDTLVYPYYDSCKFFDDLCSWSGKEDVAMIRPLVPSMVPFKKTNYSQRSVVEQYWILNSSLGINPAGMIVLSNLKKLFNKEVYFREDMKSEKCEGYEDYDFVLQLRELGLSTYICKQLVINSLIPDGSVMFGDGQRKRNHVKNICATYDCHPKLRIQYVVDNGKVKSNVSKLSTWPTQYVPRERSYQFNDNVVPNSLKNEKRVTRKLLI